MSCLPTVALRIGWCRTATTKESVRGVRFCACKRILSPAVQVVFHGKAFPWFVSDVTRRDVDWTLQQLIDSGGELRAMQSDWKMGLDLTYGR